MLKRFVVLLVLVLCLCYGSAFASVGIGLEGGVQCSAKEPCALVALTFKASNLPLIFTPRLGFLDETLLAGFSLDYCFSNPRLGGIFHAYWALGNSFAVAVTSGSFDGIYIAPRAVLGINTFALDPAELYVQGACELGLSIKDGVDFPVLNFPITAGLRLWF